MLLAENGVFIRTRGIKLHMGQILNVVPKYLEGLFAGENQLLILSTEEEKKQFDEEMMWNIACAMGQEQLQHAPAIEPFNRVDLSLKAYCEKKFTEEMK